MSEFTPEPRWVVVRRRLLTIPRAVLLFIVAVALAPIAIPVAAMVDAARWAATRKPAMTLRLLAFGFVFSAVELIGLMWLGVSWLRASVSGDHRRLRGDAWPIQVWWARTLFAAVKRLFRIEVLVVGRDQIAPGPIIAAFRHASIVDNLLPAVLITAEAGIKLRWIVKKELLTLPSLDVAGKRLPNYFVDRNSDDPRGELRRIRALANDLEADEGVLIYPEGTRFTVQRRARALDRLRSSGDSLLERAQLLRHVMPPRPGGMLTLLDSGADVVVGAHHGLEGFAKIGDLWSGALVGKRVSVQFKRIPASSIPQGRRQRVDWLYDVWADIDAWVDERVID